MAGVFCVWDPGGTHDAAAVRAAHHRMDYRGTDGERLVSVDDVHLGHQHSHATPTGAATEQPLRDGDVWLAVDGRVDNRAALRRDLYGEVPDADHANSPEAGRSDAALLLDAYRAFGTDFPERVVGPLAAVVYDAAAGRLQVVRGRTGLRQVFYGRPEGALVVASDRTPVVSLFDGPVGVCERRVAEHVEDHTLTPGLTVYEGVYRLPPGHTAVVDTDGRVASDDGAGGGAGGPDEAGIDVEVREYWHPTETPLPASEPDLRAELDERCRTAVAARLRSTGPVGTELSGGLDSTTVAALAAELSDESVAAYSLVFESVGDAALTRAERGRIRDVAAAHGLDRHEVVADDLGPRLDAPFYDPVALEGPVVNKLSAAFRALYERAAGTDTRVLLTGEGGNAFDGKQSGYVDLLRQGRVATAVRSMLRDDTSNWQLGWFTLVKLAGLVGGRFPDERTFGPGSVLAEDLRERVTGARPGWPADAMPGAPADALPGAATATHPGGLAYPQSRYDLLVTQDAHRSKFHSPFLDLLAFDRRLALAVGVDVRHPLLDARVIDLAYSLPQEFRMRAGRRKYLFRQWVAPLLPDGVLVVGDGPTFEPLVTRGLAAERGRVETLLGSEGPAKRDDDGGAAARRDDDGGEGVGRDDAIGEPTRRDDAVGEPTRRDHADGVALVRRGFLDADTLASLVRTYYRNPPDADAYSDVGPVPNGLVWRLATTERWLRDAVEAGIVEPSSGEDAPSQ